MRNSLPLLEQIDNLKVLENSFSELLFDDIDESIEKMSLKYISGLLSNFEVILDKDDERINFLSDAYYMKSQEYKYIDFIDKVFEENDNLCIIDTHLFRLNYDYFLGYLNSGIDIKFQYLLLHQYIHLFNTKNRFFYIKDKELLKLFFIFSLRENMLSNFFLFPKENICLISNFDCLFPIFYKEEFLFEKYHNFSKDTGLYLIKK